ncbi:MAG: UDP-N-acetylmuramate--L-alanine ligase [Bacillota bacterium]
MTEDREWTHFVGIGGAGMSGLAKILLALGYPVSGSDLKKSKVTDRLERAGALIVEGHSPQNLRSEVDLVVVSTAIPKENPEMMEAQAKGIPVIQRAELLARLMKRQKAIAVAGAHGKTTTTSMIAMVLDKNGLDPTVIVGGELNDIGGNARLGHGRYLVAEADESDKSFLKLCPYIAVITNIENDHLDNYGTFANIVGSFEEFIEKVPEEGFVVACTDDPELKRIAKDGRRKFITYGLNGSPDYSAKKLKIRGLGSTAEVYYRKERLGILKLGVPGKHNVSNALAAVAVGHELGLPFDDIATALATFRGVDRRFQILGISDGIQVVDDYGHHPTEIRATLAAAKATNPRRLIVAFQPHRYSRTKLLAKEFGPAFQDADLAIITDIYAAGEAPIEGISGETIAREAASFCPHVEYIPGLEEVVQYLLRVCEPGDLVLTMGAGNIYQAGEVLVEHLTARNEISITLPASSMARGGKIG